MIEEMVDITIGYVLIKIVYMLVFLGVTYFGIKMNMAVIAFVGFCSFCLIILILLSDIGFFNWVATITAINY